ncbi:glycoside hydrolase family 16 protein [Niveomyces insectorum RCEF 264]|uniref:chitinase n=1 Tax=Niveomyces insectorum RCEF 264 TaxID=1081102 RepID=A0A167T5S1_9HYPO|nr:glycoside hydrolase family 16 protein [Niveomyces insectorum RCEF 264]
MTRSLLFAAGAALFALLARPSSAQVDTACQPLNTTDCPADPAFGTDHMFHFNATPSADIWEPTAGVVSYSLADGAAFTINKQGDSPTIRSTFYIFFGRTEILMKAASGTGIISSVMLLSDDLDEIDLEFMGGNASSVETNYFGKGRKDFNNAIYAPVNGGVQADFHNYTTVWTNTSLVYYVDGQVIRTLLPKDANNTNNYPQTPARISLGIWAGGDPSLPVGTRQWAGGDTDFSKAPFSMYVRSIQVTDYNTGKEYSYGDMSGSWESIKIASGNSTALKTLNAKPAESLSEKWDHLSPVAHTAVYASAAGVGAILLACLLYYCIKQRRRGAREARAYEEQLARERLELEQYKKAGIDPDGLTMEGAEYNAHDMSKDGLISSDAYSVPPTPTGFVQESKWGVAGAAGAADAPAMRSPVPLLQNGAQSPQHNTNHHGFDFGGGGAFGGNLDPHSNRTQTPAPPISPMRSPSPGMPPSYSLPPRPVSRSFSTPNAPMRGSPGPHMGGDPGVMRTQSPAQAMPTPQRSFTTDTWRGQSNNAGGGYSAQQPHYGGGGGPGYGGQGGSGGYGGNMDNNHWR